ncbi:uncharacterized protein LOC116159916 [Photinus pyralis]|uniref:uncharacterized protein LOC116159916 n=1 Tax=Photinus pyralis TaxID=7054 RepID=UPI0012677B0D|nr:uncharacterized protein LOC116159916 [Photinus pyralis]
MRCIIVAILLCACVQYSTQQNLLELVKFKNECVSEYNITSSMIKSVVKELINADFTNLNQLKDFPICLMTKIGLIDKDGNVNPNALKKYVGVIPKGKEILEVANECKDRRGENVADTIYEVGLCVIQGAIKKMPFGNIISSFLQIN